MRSIEGFGVGSGAEGFLSHSPEQVISDEDIVEAAFQYYRELGFPYRKLPLHVCMQMINKLARTNNKELIRTMVGYHVADTYHPHRFDGRHSAKKESPSKLFEDDRHLRICLMKTLTLMGSIGSGWFAGLIWANGSRVLHNFRPGFALRMYRKYTKPGATVLDTSTGYGGRLVGFLASDCGEYIGVDPNTLTDAGNRRMADDLARNKKVELFNLPAEDVPHDAVRERVDFAFTSPPYFATEIYSEEDTQSCNRYPTSVGWRDGFLLPMMAMQYAALKPGAITAVNIADVKVKSESVPLVKWTIIAAKKVGFKVLRDEFTYFPLGRHFGKGKGRGTGTETDAKGGRREPVLVFQKPG